MEVTLQEAKKRLSNLLQRAAMGGDIIITRGGKRIARLVTIEEQRPRRPRPLGLAKGQFVVPDDFDDPLPEFERDFYGEE